ncbi:SEC-C metal-binding domain-containing protein [Nisaea sediminum]|uniref:SEC-C metal-binding domain-containing protein n=1 Tax=Nisaea sediminum TaxID=2775867 RepID=UPI001D014825
MFEPCPCGSGKTYLGCCGRLHSGAPARDAGEPMRALLRLRAREYGLPAEEPGGGDAAGGHGNPPAWIASLPSPIPGFPKHNGGSRHQG